MCLLLWKSSATKENFFQKLIRSIVNSKTIAGEKICRVLQCWASNRWQLRWGRSCTDDFIRASFWQEEATVIFGSITSEDVFEEFWLGFFFFFPRKRWMGLDIFSKKKKKKLPITRFHGYQVIKRHYRFLKCHYRSLKTSL